MLPESSNQKPSEGSIPKTYHVYQTGCGIIKAYAKYFEQYLENHGVHQAPNPDEADYIVIGTCTVDHRSIGQATERIEACRNCAKDQNVIVAGCLVDYDRPLVERLFKGTILSLSQIMETPDPFSLGEPYADGEVPYFFPINKNYLFSSGKEASHYGLINICTGCLHKCTYCVHPLIFKGIHSLAPEKIVNIVKEGVANNVKEFILWAQDIYSYGRDINTNIIELLISLVKLKGDFTLNLGGLYPGFVDRLAPDLIELLASDKIIKMECDLQSGSPRLLKLMGRKYDLEQVAENIRAFREVKPDLMVHTHVMLGFPTETTEDVHQTADFLLQADFTSVSVFSFSPHPRTRAFDLQPRVPLPVVKERFEMLKTTLKDKEMAMVDYIPDQPIEICT